MSSSVPVQGAPRAGAHGFANAATEELKATNEQLLQENNKNRAQINELTTHMQSMLKELEPLTTPYNPTGFAPAPPQTHWSPAAFQGGNAMLAQMAHWNQQMDGPMMMPPVDVTQFYQHPPPPQGGQGDGGGGRGGNGCIGPDGTREPIIAIENSLALDAQVLGDTWHLLVKMQSEASWATGQVCTVKGHPI